MKKILCGLAALSLLGVACSREDSVSTRVEDMNPQYETDMRSDVGTGVSEERPMDSDLERSDMEMDSAPSDMEIQREEEEMIPVDDVNYRRGTGTGAGSSDAAGMGMDE